MECHPSSRGEWIAIQGQGGERGDIQVLEGERSAIQAPVFFHQFFCNQQNPIFVCMSAIQAPGGEVGAIETPGVKWVR